jgi:hypothetical protein
MRGVNRYVLAAAATGQSLGDTGSDFTYAKLLDALWYLVQLVLQLGELATIGAVVWYGLRMAFSRDDAAAYSAAKGSLVKVFIGGLLIFGAYTIIATVRGTVQSIGQ